MIIKSDNKTFRPKSFRQLLYQSGYILAGLIVVALVFVLVKQFVFAPQAISDEAFVLLTDAEKIEGSDFVLDGHKVAHMGRQTSDYAYDGRHSIVLSKKVGQYGFTTVIKGVKKGDFLRVRVWAYSPYKEIGRLAISSHEKDKIYLQSDDFNFDDAWQQIEISTEIKQHLKDDELKVYCFNFNDQPVYFDHLSYSIQTDPQLDDVAEWNPKKIRIFVKEGEFNHLKKKRFEAIKRGLLINEEDSWVKGAIFPESEKASKTKVSLRLKGDWTDHLQGSKWSFRVQTEATKSWNRLKTFSLQNPSTRSYLYEWLLHAFFNYEDILTTRYDFVQFELNNKDLGLYVYEEHFLKQIPEFNKKKEGPIVRFIESGFWDAMLQKDQLKADHDGSLIVGAPDIKPFGEKRTHKDSLLAQQFDIAHTLLYQYQYGLKEAKDIFDVDLYARYYVVMDLIGGYHGIAWHNQRFYYNQVIGKLEPIGFDGFGGEGLAYVPEKPFLGINLSSLGGFSEMHKKLFRDKSFLEKYHFYLEKLTATEHLDAFLASIKKKMHQRLHLIRKYVKGYNFSPDYLYQRAANIRNALYPFSTSLKTKTIKPGIIAVCNRHQIPIEILGSVSASGGPINYLDSSVLVFTTKLDALPDYGQSVSVPQNASHLIYRIPGLVKTYEAAINKWSLPRALAPVQELKANIVEGHPAYVYQADKATLIFKKDVQITEPIIIPEGLKVMLRPGTKLDLIKASFVLSYSAVQFLGTEEAPIEIVSSDKSARSFTVLKGTGKSRINYTRFAHLGAFSFKGWNLPGAVNFYESDVDIYNTVFTHNSCEDALNIVRSTFDFKNNTICHTYADGFDADFCTGTVDNSYFHHTGNDAIDFSTSKVTIKDCSIEKVGDKGISMGEQGEALIINTKIDGANIGIASKDLSKTTVRNAELRNCIIGFSAYQKKPEYGQAFIYVDSYTAEDVQQLHKIFPGSYLKLVNTEFRGD